MQVETILGAAFFDRYLRGEHTFDGVLSQAYAVQHEPSFEFWATAITDTNSDKRTTFEDFLKLSEGFGKTGRDARSSRADFNRDSVVDFADFLLLSQNYSGVAGVTAAAVPEPNSFSMAAMVSLFLLMFRLKMRK